MVFGNFMYYLKNAVFAIIFMTHALLVKVKSPKMNGVWDFLI